MRGNKFMAKRRNRRRFLQDGLGLTGLALGAVSEVGAQVVPEAQNPDSRAYGERSRFEKNVRLPIGPSAIAMLTPLQDSMGIITPAALHFVVSRSRTNPPDIDSAQHNLMIHGMVDRPLLLTVEEIKRLPSVSRIH